MLRDGTEAPRFPIEDAPDWEKFEAGDYQQGLIPGIVEPPTAAERVFVALARRWRSSVATVKPEFPVPHSAETQALACLLLSVEWGREFGPLVCGECLENIKALERHAITGWFKTLPWRLCVDLRSGCMVESANTRELVANLNHHRSSIRLWILDIAWLVRTHLPVDDASSRLFSNIALRCIGSELSATLALALHGSIEAFDKAVLAYTPPESYSERLADFREEIESLRESGFPYSTSGYAGVENDCRALIGCEVLGERYWLTGTGA